MTGEAESAWVEVSVVETISEVAFVDEVVDGLPGPSPDAGGVTETTPLPSPSSSFWIVLLVDRIIRGVRSRGIDGIHRR